MGTYIVRRLLIMIPTLFGITVVSFCVMQLAPGDPVAMQASGGAVGRGGETPEMYQARKRELHLDKPLLWNFNYFRDFRETIRIAAYFLSRSGDELLADLPDLAAAEKDSASDSELALRLTFLRSTGIPEFRARLADRARWPTLPRLITYYVGRFCGDLGRAGVRPAIEILQDPASNEKLKIGAIHCLSAMVDQPFHYTYTIPPTEIETPAVQLPWRIWWDRNKPTLPQPDSSAIAFFDGELKQMVASPDKYEAAVEEISDSDYLKTARYYFAERLLGNTTLEREGRLVGNIEASFSCPSRAENVRWSTTRRHRRSLKDVKATGLELAIH